VNLTGGQVAETKIVVIYPRRFITGLEIIWILILCPLGFSLPPAGTTYVKPPPLAIASMKAMLFYEDKGTFSADVSEADTGPPYVPPKLWNTPLQYENRATSVLVVVEVAGDESPPERRLEFTARYIPVRGRSREIVVRKIVPIPIKVNEQDNYHAGFWLYDTGCNPVKLSARIVGRKKGAMKKVIKFGCGE